MNGPCVATLLLFIGTGAIGSCRAQPSQEPVTAEKPVASIPMPSIDEQRPRDYPGVRNAVAYHDGFVSGSAPQAEAGFDTLEAMGFKTIISVDGAEPDVAMAEARGIRYIHLPIGYRGFDEQRKLQLVRATRDAMVDGPVYIHCHHGKHRSAGAAAAIAASLGWATPEAGVRRMKVSGTAPNYRGLYACAAEARVVDPQIIEDVPADFPAIWTPPSFVRGMLEIAQAFEHLEAIEKAGWVTPVDHPDLVPAAEAGRLADLHRVLIEGAYARGKPAAFTELMRTGLERSQALEELLVAGEPESAGLSDQLNLIGTSCTDCHATYRD